MIPQGELYIVGTPIGNLKDITLRALDILRQVDFIAAEDTRHSKRLLQEYDINTRLISLHEHNERGQVSFIISHLQQGEKVALISDAGTPLISDPGFPLVRAAREMGLIVTPVPGPCAAIAALSASGLATDHFIFEGFLPATTQARKNRLQSLSRETRTIVFYESVHRVIECLEDMAVVLEEKRHLVVARELTKTYETFLQGEIREVLEQLKIDQDQQRGEFVFILSGYQPSLAADVISLETKHVMEILLEELPIKQAAHLAAKITGCRKNRLYDFALNIAKINKV